MSDHKYEKGLERLSKKLWDELDIVNNKYGTQHGFIGLLIRDPSLGNIDVMHKCTNDKDIIPLLELTIKQLKES